MKIALLLGLALTAVAGIAEAQTAAPPAEKPAWETAPATRRSGFTAGILGGMAFGSVSGYPNDYSKIDNPDFRTATSGVGPNGMIYLGGALADWFTFGFGLSQSSYGSSQIVSQSKAYLFHIEAFPFFARGGTWRDVALFADFGTGSGTVKRRSDGAEWSSGGALSIVGFGALWEAWRLAGHVALGPYAAGHYADSNSMTRYFGEIGFRGAFYGGP